MFEEAMEFNSGLADALASPDTTVHTHSGRDMYYPCNDVFVVLYVKPHLL